jgi:hypothetical protein
VAGQNRLPRRVDFDVSRVGPSYVGASLIANN